MIGSRYYHRYLESKLMSAAGVKNKVILLFGARQTGKTTLLRACTPTEDSLFLNLQDRRLRRRYESEPGLLIRELDAAARIHTVVIDEIQKVPALLEDIQFLYDRDPSRHRFILTGSSARRLKHGSANLLPGRAIHHVLSPVLQAETRNAELLGLPLPQQDRFPSRGIEDQLLYGNLPGLHSEDRASWDATLETYADLYVENEIRQESIVRDMGAFSRFLSVAALEAGRWVNYTKMAAAVGVSVNTLRSYYQVLEDTFLGFRVASFATTRKRIVSAPRFVFFDLGVRHKLANLHATPDLVKTQAGELFEQWVMAELYYRCRYHGSGFGISTWRTSTGAEVDLVVQAGSECIPVEIKWTERPTPSDARHLETFLDLHPETARRGYIVCRCPTRQNLSDRVIALPWNAF
jgi:predicted AAA+ superfamily ATPase